MDGDPVRGDRPSAYSGWPIRSASDAANDSGDARGYLSSRGAVSWYIGAGFSLLWLLSTVPDILSASSSTRSAVLGLTLLSLYGLAFLLCAPISWALPGHSRIWVAAALFALSFTLVPWLSWGVRGIWTYVGVVIGMSVLSWRMTWMCLLGLGALAAVFGSLLGGWSDDDLWIPAIIVSISAMMAAFAHTVAAMNRLRATQAQLERMAVERERGRVARDIHDILGHSLTVITVKSELARRLVDTDPARAKAEIAEVEALSRGALADVRSTVSGYRGVSVTGELAAARSALTAAGIEAELPSSTDVVPARNRELAGWIVREGVTNVVRHSQASRCRVTLSENLVEIADDGIGPTHAISTASGLSGLRDRVESVGGAMIVDRSELGGFSLRVTL